MLTHHLYRDESRAHLFSTGEPLVYLLFESCDTINTSNR